MTKLQVHQHLLPNRERKRMLLKDEKKYYGTEDKSSSEQQFRKLDSITEKTGAILLVLVGLTAGRPAVQQSDEILVIWKFLKFCTDRIFNEGTVLLSVINAFYLAFSGKVCYGGT